MEHNKIIIKEQEISVGNKLNCSCQYVVDEIFAHKEKQKVEGYETKNNAYFTHSRITNPDCIIHYMNYRK